MAQQKIFVTVFDIKKKRGISLLFLLGIYFFISHFSRHFPQTLRIVHR